MKALITGANGQLGRAVNRLLAGSDVKLINTEAPSVANLCGMKELDITDLDAVVAAVRAEAPEVIINCAAYTAVDKQEQDVDLSYRINAIGPRNLAIAATQTDARLVHISTDYVFDGTAKKPYTEFDNVSPVSVYGRTKLSGEMFVIRFARRFFILRTAWLYGDGGNFVRTMLRLAKTQREVNVVSDQIGTPTSATELAKAIRFLYESDNYGIFHATCEGSCSWADFAERIFSVTGSGVHVNRVSTEEYVRNNPLSAPRPANSVLDNYMLRLTSDYRFAEWQDAIDSYLAGEGK